MNAFPGTPHGFDGAMRGCDKQLEMLEEVDMPSSREILGVPPVQKVFIFFFGSAAFTLLAIFLAFAVDGKMGAIVIVIAFILWLFLGYALLHKLIEAAICRKTYWSARRAIDNGLVPSYVGMNFLSDGIFIVDEINRKIFVNDGVYSFSDVRNVRISGNNSDYIEINMRSGSHPQKTIKIGVQAEANNLFVRLCNSLQFEIN